MGQKYSGTNINTITGFEIAAKKPIDPRMQVDTKADLEKIQYQWVGMTVFVEDEGEDYQLKTSGWVKKSTQGPKGDKGETGAVGPKGADGKSAYEVWVAQPGNAGKNEQEYLASLKGAKGDKGETGAAGAKGDRGETGAVGPQGAEGAQGPAGQKGEKGDPFSIAKVYKSVAEMNSGYAADGVPQGGFVVINTGNVLHYYTMTEKDAEYSYLALFAVTAGSVVSIELSGASGPSFVCNKPGGSYSFAIIKDPILNGKVNFRHGGTGDGHVFKLMIK